MKGTVSLLSRPSGVRGGRDSEPDAEVRARREATRVTLRPRIGSRASPCKPSRLYLGALVPYEPRVRILSAALLPLILLVPSATEAQPKPKTEFKNGPVGKAVPPCGARILPLVEGNRWTYGFIAAPISPREDLAKLSPSQPSQV